jgi:hypothetical protein
VFEAEYPHLKEKALKLLGPVLYFDLSPMCGQPLQKDQKLYRDLWKIHEKIDASVVKDLHALNIKLSTQLRPNEEGKSA